MKALLLPSVSSPLSLLSSTKMIKSTTKPSIMNGCHRAQAITTTPTLYANNCGARAGRVSGIFLPVWFNHYVIVVYYLKLELMSDFNNYLWQKII
jgi:hypothetical protein